MKWVFLRHERPDRKRDGADTSIKPSFCHPFYYKYRIKHVHEAHGATTPHIERLEEFGMDLGGMLMASRDKAFTIRLSPDRTFSCWQHQLGEVIHVLEGSTQVEMGTRRFHKFARWPGMICFISEADLRKILPVLRRELARQTREDQ